MPSFNPSKAELQYILGRAVASFDNLTANELEKLHQKHLKAIDKRNKIQRPLYYLIYTLFVTILCLCFAIGWFKIQNKDLGTQNQEIYKLHYRFIKDKNLDAVYQEWIGNYGD